MCVIIAKNKTDRLPTIEELTACFEHNPDGAGFMYVINKRVVIDKGYMTLKSFLKHFKKLCAKYHDFNNRCLVVHCRIGTAGSNSAENTHPYPITNNSDDLHKPYFLANVGVAHNGIISKYNPLLSVKDSNDTQEFIKQFMYPLSELSQDFYKNKGVQDILDRITSSKLAILNSDDELYTVGDFTIDDGLKFSNTSYKSYKCYPKYWDYSYKYNDNYTTSYKNDDDLDKYNSSFDDVEVFDLDNNELDLFDIPEGYYLQAYACESQRVERSHVYAYDLQTGDLYRYTLDGDVEFVGSNYDVLNSLGEVVY